MHHMFLSIPDHGIMNDEYEWDKVEFHLGLQIYTIKIFPELTMRNSGRFT